MTEPKKLAPAAAASILADAQALAVAAIGGAIRLAQVVSLPSATTAIIQAPGPYIPEGREVVAAVPVLPGDMVVVLQVGRQYVIVANITSPVSGGSAVLPIPIISGAGTFLLPAGGSASDSLNQAAAANTYGSYSQLVASAAVDLYILGFQIEMVSGAVLAFGTTIQLAIGAAASEVSIGEYAVGGTSLNSAVGQRAGMQAVMFNHIIPVAAGTRIAWRVASSKVTGLGYNGRIICVAQADYGCADCPEAGA